MFTFIIFSSLICVVKSSNHPFSNPFFDWPININLTMNKFNSANCTTINESISYILNCKNTNYDYEYRQCCYDELNKLSPFTALVFNSCYTAEYNNTDYIYFNYECSDADVFNYTLADIAMIVFFITAFGLIVFIAIYIINRMCGSKVRHGYNSIN